MIQFRIIPEYRLVLFCNWGKTSEEDIYKIKKKFRTSFMGMQDYDALLNLSQSEAEYTKEDIRKLAMPSSLDLFPGRKLAIVASTDLSFGMSRMYEMTMYHDRSCEISVFRDTVSALVWLGREGIEARVDKMVAAMMVENAERVHLT